jgi:hypothetical protein
VNADGGNVAFDGGFKQTSGNTNLGGGSISSLASIDIEGGSLTGTGAINGTVNVGSNGSSAIVVPGASPGIITIFGNLTLGPDAVLNMELFSTSLFDQIVANGSIILGGKLNVAAVGFSPGAGDVFPLVVSTVDDITGVFAVANLPALNAPLTGDVVEATFRVLAGQTLPPGIFVPDTDLGAGNLPGQVPPPPGGSVSGPDVDTGFSGGRLIPVLLSLLDQIPESEQLEDLEERLRKMILECR